jgi:hypothetical protein
MSAKLTGCKVTLGPAPVDTESLAELVVNVPMEFVTSALNLVPSSLVEVA